MRHFTRFRARSERPLDTAANAKARGLIAPVLGAEREAIIRRVNDPST